MCNIIAFCNGEEVQTVREFQQKFNVDARLYGWDGNEEFIDCCLCDIDLEQFFKLNPEHVFYYDGGDWWEGEKE